MQSSLQNTNFSLNHYKKRPYDNYERMTESDISQLYAEPGQFMQVVNENKTKVLAIDTQLTNDNPVYEYVSSNSNKKIKTLVRRLSYRSPKSGSSSSSSTSEHSDPSFTSKNLEDLYEVSLSLDRKKIIQKVQRQIHGLLAKAGKSGSTVSNLEEQLDIDTTIIKEAIHNLKKMKRIMLLNKNTFALVESTKFLPGNKYSVFIEKVMVGKAVVRVNDKWYASLDHHDYFGPRALLKKGNILEIIGEMYRREGVLHLIIKKIL